MSSYTHFNIRFRPKEKRLINVNDFRNLENDIFSNTSWSEFSKKISTSWLGMLIFELNQESNSIYLEITPIRAHYLTYILDNIRDKGEFEIWTICTWEEGNDWLEIYDNNFEENYSSTCIYIHDEIRVNLIKGIDSNDLPNSFIKVNENQFQYKSLGKYFANNEVIEYENLERKSSILNKCLLADRNNYILDNCLKQTPESDWYSDQIISIFMKSLTKGEFSKIIDSVEFRYKSKLVRLYNKREHKECYILDNWFNLDEATFKNWKNRN